MEKKFTHAKSSELYKKNEKTFRDHSSGFDVVMKKLLSTLLIILHLTSISNSATISEPFIKENSSGDVTYAFDIYCEFDRGQFMYGSDLQRKISTGGWVSFKLILRDDSYDNESK